MSTTAYRKSQKQVVTLATRELRNFWNALNRSNPVAVKEAVSEFMVDLTESYGSIAQVVAADYYDEVRARAGVRGKYAAHMPAVDVAEKVVGSSNWAVQPMFGDSPDEAATLSRLEGSAQRHIQTFGRDTITRNSVRDPGAAGWQRITAGGCDFCVMLAGRGAVYSEESADFESHDHCKCSAEPVFDKNATASESTDWRPKSEPKGAPDTTIDVDAGRTIAQLRDTLAGLERALAKFETPGTRARVEDLRRKIKARTK